MTDNYNIGNIILKAGDILRSQGVAADDADNAILAVYDDFSIVAADMLALNARIDLHGFLLARLVMDARAYYYGITDYEIVRQAEEAEEEREAADRYLSVTLTSGTDDEIEDAQERRREAETAYTFIAQRCGLVEAARANLQAYSRACIPR